MARVLVVEDDREVRIVIEEALKARGFDVWAVANEVIAYKVLETDAASVSVLIADLNLGYGATGKDVVLRALRLNPSIKVLYCTGEDTDVGRFKLRGGILCRKPVPVDVLGDMVEALAAERHGQGPSAARQKAVPLEVR
jgi:DNA-binding NtrC family response regulator